MVNEKGGQFSHSRPGQSSIHFSTTLPHALLLFFWFAFTFCTLNNSLSLECRQPSRKWTRSAKSYGWSKSSAAGNRRASGGAPFYSTPPQTPAPTPMSQPAPTLAPPPAPLRSTSALSAVASSSLPASWTSRSSLPSSTRPRKSSGTQPPARSRCRAKPVSSLKSSASSMKTRKSFVVWGWTSSCRWFPNRTTDRRVKSHLGAPSRHCCRKLGFDIVTMVNHP